MMVIDGGFSRAYHSETGIADIPWSIIHAASS